MKKPTAKLVVRRETFRVLSSLELTRAVGGDGGDAIVVLDTGLRACTQARAVPPAG